MSEKILPEYYLRDMQPRSYPLNVIHLFASLDHSLIELLRSLSPEEWNAQTVAKRWKVKDVAAHLLDGNIRVLSIQRDRYFGETPGNISSYTDLVDWLNELNASWVKANQRISPGVMIMLHEATSQQVTHYFEQTDLDAEAIFPVSWAGEDGSKNWFHIAREYTEKWLHQQQIRDAVNRPGILTAEYFKPFMDTLIYAMPHTLKDTEANTGTVICLQITGNVSLQYHVRNDNGKWVLTDMDNEPSTIISIDANDAWKLFSKSIRPNEIRDRIAIKGDNTLALQALNMVAFMA